MCRKSKKCCAFGAKIPRKFPFSKIRTLKITVKTLKTTKNNLEKPWISLHNFFRNPAGFTAILQQLVMFHSEIKFSFPSSTLKIYHEIRRSRTLFGRFVATLISHWVSWYSFTSNCSTYLTRVVATLWDLPHAAANPGHQIFPVLPINYCNFYNVASELL